jgi:secondary thiamine-phosphate synthase enzyme
MVDMDAISIFTAKRNEFVDITSKVQNIVLKCSVKDGLCVIYCPHTTAGLTINENADPNVTHDILNYLERLVPSDSRFKHSEGNSDAHIKASLMGSSVTVLIEGGKLVLGTWQGIYFCEFDGPRSRKVLVGIK